MCSEDALSALLCNWTVLGAPVETVSLRRLQWKFLPGAMEGVNLLLVNSAEEETLTVSAGDHGCAPASRGVRGDGEFDFLADLQKKPVAQHVRCARPQLRQGLPTRRPGNALQPAEVSSADGDVGQ